MRESDDEVNFEQWGVVPKQSANEKRDGELNEDYDLHFLSLEGSPVEVLGGLVAFRPIPSVGEWVFCLLLLWNGEAAVGNRCDVVVGYVESMSGLNGSSDELAGGCGFLDEEEVEECDKQEERGEQIEHESRGKVQALSFCQQLIQLWLRSRLKQQTLAKRRDFQSEERGSLDQVVLTSSKLGTQTYVHELYILDTDNRVTILLVDKTTIAIIYKGSYKIPKTE